MEGVILRPLQDDDHNFIVNSFVKELHDQFPNKHVDQKIFFKNQTPIVKQILANSLVLVACSEENKSQIFGYCIFEKINTDTIIHFIYVKLNFRGFGIGKLLLNTIDSQFANKDVLISYLPRRMENQTMHQTLVKYKLRYDPFVINRRVKWS